MRRFGLLAAMSALVFGVAIAPAGAASLTFVQRLAKNAGGPPGLGFSYRIVVSPDGLHAYSTGTSDHALVAWSRDPATGQLSWIGALFDGVGGVEGLGNTLDLVMAPDGHHLYVVDFDSKAVSVFARDPVTGTIAYASQVKDGVGGLSGMGAPFGLGMSPDGKFLYAAASSTMTVFARDPVSGALTFVQHVDADQLLWADVFSGDPAVVVSPDGQHLYVTSNASNTISLFSRDLVTGQISFLNRWQDGQNGITGMLNPYGLAISPDGANVYVPGTFGADALVVFARDAATGALTWMQTLPNGAGGVTGMKTPFSVTVSVDGGKVFVGAASTAALATFARDAATGALTFVDTLIDQQGLMGLYGVRQVMPSTDGKFLYTAAYDGQAVSAFEIVGGLPPTTSTTTLAGVTTTSTTTTTTTTSTTTTTLPSCPPAPRTGCRTSVDPGRTPLKLRDGNAAAKDRLQWTWRNGAATTLADFGDPTVTTDYRLCVYENANQAPALVLDAFAPAGGTCGASPCWTVRKRGLRYRDRNGSPDGLIAVALRPGADGKAMVLVHGRGADLPLPALPLLAPVTVQLSSSDGLCWETTDSTN